MNIKKQSEPPKAEYPLLATKLFVPHPRPDQVQRKRLLDLLNGGIHCKLTLISAPAGFGKTAILCDWISQNEIATAWISLDKSDNDSIQFIQYLIAALRTVNPLIGEAVIAQLKVRPRPEIRSVLINLITEIADHPTELILVFDDYHSIDTENIHQLVGTLLDYLPAQVHVVIATRVDPPLPLARLRVSNQLSELRTADLIFTVDEIAAFFNEMLDLKLTKNDISTLESRTEGWVASLQLAAISMQGRDDVASFIATFAGDDRHIVDYLVEEVLDRQTEKIQNFLLQTSILSRLSKSLCDFVTGEKGSQRILNGLESSNLFLIPLDNKRQWYRYHHLFAELLLQRLHQAEGDLVNKLHLKASKWFGDNDLVHEAVNHALAAKDYDRAGYLVKSFVYQSWDYDSRMLEWHKKLPDDIVNSDAKLSFFMAWMLYENGLYDNAEVRLKIVESLTVKPGIDAIRKQDNVGEVQAQDIIELRGRVAAVRACISYFKGQIDDTIGFSERAIKNLNACDSYWRGIPLLMLGLALHAQGRTVEACQKFRDAASLGKIIGDYYLFLLASLRLADIQRVQGDPAGILGKFEALYKTAQEEGLSQSPMLGWLYCSWGDALCDLNKLDEAIHFIQQGLELSLQSNEMSMIGKSHLSMGKILFLKGDLAGAEDIMHEIESISQKSKIPLGFLDSLDALRVRIWLKKGEIEPAVLWMEKRKARENQQFNFLIETEPVLFSRILFTQGCSEKALEILQHLNKTPEVLLLLAVILKSQGELSGAFSSLKKALALTEPGGAVSIYLEEGQPIAELLHKLVDEDKDIPRAYIKKLLSAASLNKLIQTDDEGLVERLSERELEVLRYMAAGLSNKKITEALFISLSTVKTHLRNIYSKLSVNSRTQATVKAKEIGLL